MQVAVDEQDDGETHADLGRRDREHEQREHLARSTELWNAPNATRLMFTAASISSMLISTSTVCLRVSTP